MPQFPLSLPLYSIRPTTSGYFIFRNLVNYFGFNLIAKWLQQILIFMPKSRATKTQILKNLPNQTKKLIYMCNFG